MYNIQMWFEIKLHYALLVNSESMHNFEIKIICELKIMVAVAAVHLAYT